MQFHVQWTSLLDPVLQLNYIMPDAIIPLIAIKNIHIARKALSFCRIIYEIYTSPHLLNCLPHNQWYCFVNNSHYDSIKEFLWMLQTRTQKLIIKQTIETERWIILYAHMPDVDDKSIPFSTHLVGWPNVRRLNIRYSFDEMYVIIHR